MAPRPLIAGNWKMNGLREAQSELSDTISGISPAYAEAADILICPPYTLIAQFAQIAAGSAVQIGSQDCHTQDAGAHTGDISAQMIKDAGARFAIVGHSERRTDHGETSELVHQKALAAQGQGLTAIVCVGETEAQRDAGDAWRIVSEQVERSVPESAGPANTVIAYEPVWAIGTGRTPTMDDIATMHGDLRKAMIDRFGSDGSEFRLLYGGSMKPGNAADILAVDHVNGGLIGGASLKASDFLGIIAAA